MDKSTVLEKLRELQTTEEGFEALVVLWTACTKAAGRRFALSLLLILKNKGLIRSYTHDGAPTIDDSIVRIVQEHVTGQPRSLRIRD